MAAVVAAEAVVALASSTVVEVVAAAMANVRETFVAGLYWLLPVWEAVMTQLPWAV